MSRLTGVPIDSAGSAGGTELAPAAFRSMGLGDVFERRDCGDLDLRIRAERRDPATGVVGLDDVVSTTTEIRRAVGAALQSGEIPFLIGGCCALVPGALAGVSRGCYNPEKDREGANGRRIVQGFADVLG